jgi:hypothetical protein
MVSYKLSIIKFMALLLAMSGTATAALSTACITDGTALNSNSTNYDDLVKKLYESTDICKADGKTITCDFKDTVAPLETVCNDMGGQNVLYAQETKCDDKYRLVVRAMHLCIGKSCTEADKKEVVEGVEDMFATGLVDDTDLKGCKTASSQCESASKCNYSGASASLGGIAMTMTATAALAFLAAV